MSRFCLGFRNNLAILQTMFQLSVGLMVVEKMACSSNEKLKVEAAPSQPCEPRIELINFTVGLLKLGPINAPNALKLH